MAGEYGICGGETESIEKKSTEDEIQVWDNNCVLWSEKEFI